jgi:hypothetical protein
MTPRPLRLRLVATALLPLLALGCVAAPPRKDLTKFVAAQPRSILVLPPVNNSVDLTAADYFLSTVPLPLAERGYYVFPVQLVKRLLEDDGMADAGMVHQAPPDRLGELFGADTILYITIEKWTALYVVLSTSVTVEFDYKLRDVKTGEIIWQDHEVMVYSSGSGNSGGGGVGTLIAMVVAAAVEKAAPNYMPLARQANAKALAYPGPGFPDGPYLDRQKKLAGP